MGKEKKGAHVRFFLPPSSPVDSKAASSLPHENENSLRSYDSSSSTSRLRPSSLSNPHHGPPYFSTLLSTSSPLPPLPYLKPAVIPSSHRHSSSSALPGFPPASLLSFATSSSFIGRTQASDPGGLPCGQDTTTSSDEEGSSSSDGSGEADRDERVSVRSPLAPRDLLLMDEDSDDQSASSESSHSGSTDSFPSLSSPTLSPLSSPSASSAPTSFGASSAPWLHSASQPQPLGPLSTASAARGTPGSPFTSERPPPSTLPPPSSNMAPPVYPGQSGSPTTFGCVHPFDNIEDAEDLAAALESWLIPPASKRQPSHLDKKTKIRFGLEVGRLEEPKCSIRVSYLTGAEGRKARKWADVRSKSVAISLAFIVKEDVDELGELSGNVKNLLMLLGSEMLDTDLESKLVDEGPQASKKMLLNLTFRDECFYQALNEVLHHHHVERVSASLLLSQSPGECKSRRASQESVQARLAIDATLSRSTLHFLQELATNLRKEAMKMMAAVAEEKSLGRRLLARGRGLGTVEAKDEAKQRQVAGALLRQYALLWLSHDRSSQLGEEGEDKLISLIRLLRALNDVRFFVEFDSLDELLLQLWKNVPKNTKTDESKERGKRVKKPTQAKTKLMSADIKRYAVRNDKQSSADSLGSRRNSVKEFQDDGGNKGQSYPHYSWHSLHDYLLRGYEAVLMSQGGSSQSEGHDFKHEIESGVLASVHDMFSKLQSLQSLHSLRIIIGDEVLLLACEGLDIFQVLPSVVEMEQMERLAAEAREQCRPKAKPKKEGKTRKKESKVKKQSTPKGKEPTNSDPPTARLSLPPKREKVNIKLLLLGSSRVGKTNLIQRFVRGNSFTMPKYKPTFAADFVHKNVLLRGKLRTLQIWDTSGNERQRAPDRAFFKGIDALILVFNQRRSSTFSALDRHLDDFLAHSFCPDPKLLPVVVIGNQHETKKESGSENEEHEVKPSQAEAWCRNRIKGNQLFAYFEASALEGTNVDAAFLHAASVALGMHGS